MVYLGGSKSPRAHTMSPSRPLRLAMAALAAAWLGTPTGAQDQAPPASELALPAFLDRLEAAFQTKDVAGWLALREFATPEERTLEEETLRVWFAADEVVFTLLRRPSARSGETRFVVEAQVFIATEPRARVVFWTLMIERRAAGWAVVSRQEVSQMDGLVHLSLGPQAFRARGVTLREKEFELRLEDGTLFSSPEAVGPTLLVFVGKGRVRFKPAPASEREQLRQFSGQPSLEREVDWAFVRIHPVEFQRLVAGQPLEPEPSPGRRRAEAERIFRERSERSFIVDAPLPRSPWWLMPGVADVVVDFPGGRKRVLTFALTSNEVEDVNLFDRDNRLQICSYSSSGNAPRYSEDDDRALDVLEHDISARLDPDNYEITATHRMWVRLVNPTATIRLRLDDDFRVSSVQSGDGGNLLFFRVRDQGTLVVSLGPLASREEPFTLVTRYSGRHNPAAVDQEIVQVAARQASPDGSDEVFMERPPIVYANRTSWYPRPPNEDFALARVVLDTPEGWLAVTGGEQVSSRTSGGRTRSEFRMARPGKFLTAIVGRLTDVGLRQEGALSVRGYALPRTRRETLEQMQEVERMLAFYAEKFGPSPYPTLGLVVAEGETPGGHSPPGLLYLQQRPPILRARAAARRSLELQRPARLLPGPRGGAPVVGPGHGARELSRALAVRGLGPVRGGAVAARAARRAGVPHDDGPHERLGHAPRRDRPDPSRPAPRAPEAGAALLPLGRLRQGRLGAAHAAQSDGRPGLLRGGRAPSWRTTAIARRAPKTCARRSRPRAGSTSRPTSSAGSTRPACPR